MNLESFSTFTLHEFLDDVAKNTPMERAILRELEARGEGRKVKDTQTGSLFTEREIERCKRK